MQPVPSCCPTGKRLRKCPPSSMPSLSPHFCGPETKFWITSWESPPLVFSTVHVVPLKNFYHLFEKRKTNSTRLFQHSRRNLVLSCLHAFTSALPSSPLWRALSHISPWTDLTCFSSHGIQSLCQLLER